MKKNIFFPYCLCRNLKSEVILGFSISLNFLKEAPFVPPLPPLDIVFALFKATIHSSYLSWTDLSELQKNFPTRVTIVDSLVVLKGPVLIVPPNTNSVIFNVALASLYGITMGFFASRVINRHKELRTFVLFLTTSMVSFSLYQLFSRTIYINPGIYLPNP